MAFLRHERRREHDALIEPSLLTNRTYLSGIAVMLGLFGAFGGLLLCISLFGQLGEGWGPVHAGLTLTPMVVGMIAGMAGSMALVARLGRHLLHLGVVTIAAGAATLALTIGGAQSATTWDLVPGLFLIGAGASTSIGQLFQFILTSVSMDEVGSASASWRRPSSCRPRSASPCWARSSSRSSSTTSRPRRWRSPRGRAWRRWPSPSCSCSGLPTHAREAAH